MFQSEERLLDLPLPALMGHHQIANAGTAVAAALRLRSSLSISDAAIERGLLEVRWPARMQQLNNGLLSRLLMPGSELWLDGGHNVAGGQAVAQTLAELEERAPKPVGLSARHDGPEGRGGLPRAFPGSRAPRRDRAYSGWPGRRAHNPDELAALAAVDRLQCGSRAGRAKRRSADCRSAKRSRCAF